MSTRNKPLSERASVVLTRLIEHYVATGSPVGSTTLARAKGVDVSSATVRNVMADLEDCGLIQSPHTSAGRVPTALGYRVFIDSILQTKPTSCVEIEQIEKALYQIDDPKELIQNASKLLSDLTSFAGVVSMPDSDHSCFKQIEFLRLSNRRVLAILVTTDGLVENKVLGLDKDYSESELVQASNYFNQAYQSQTMFAVRQDLLDKMAQDSDSVHEAMKTAVEMAQSLLKGGEEESSSAVLLSGEDNLMGLPDFVETEQLKNLLDTFHTKQVLLDLVSRSLKGEGIKIFIGEESGYEALEGCSVVTMPYRKEGHRVGVLGVIGPTRMPYGKVVSVVDVTARLLSSALSH